jgi:hypothetical protein
MSGILGNAYRSASDDTYINTVGQQIVFDDATEHLEKWNMDFQQTLDVFVEETIEIYKERYKLPGGGRMSERGRGGGANATRPYGEWDVAYPLRDYAEQLASDRRDFAHLTVAEWRLHVENIQKRYINEVRYRILRRLLNNTNFTFQDNLKGALTVKPLANGDTDNYPAVPPSTSEATDDHYLGTSYTAANIADGDNNPYLVIRPELEEHFTESTGGNDTVVFHAVAQTAAIEDLNSFDSVVDNFIRAGDNRDIPERLPNVPGKIIGRVNGCWAVEWRWVPENYLIAISLEEKAPLKRRVEPSATGLPNGLTLVTENEQFPMRHAIWESIEGYGTGNRLNGVVMFVGGTGSYTVPTGY